MIRLPSTHAAITAPLVASSTNFPGILIGRSCLDGRPFHLSPVLADTGILPSTNSLGMGGLGSGKSTTGKVRSRREIRDHNDQYVVIDLGEDEAAGEWSALTRSVGGLVVDARQFTLNPCSPLFPPQVREQLIRSLILAVEPAALTPQSTHALQHALSNPKATSLPGLVGALVRPEDGRWPAAKLCEWGEGAALALSRYTEGSLMGLFDGQDASLPPIDLPMLSFDFSRLDRNSPAIPSLMAAVSCWAEHVWLRQSTALHKHLVLEEAWQILQSPATAGLIQRLLKNSRRLGLSLDVLMHTISDLGEGKAQDLARLCEIFHIGRLGPEEAAIVGALTGLPQWAINEIPNLGQGEAVWKVGPHYVDIVATKISSEEARLTDTSSRRRKAQEAAGAMAVEMVAETAETDIEGTDVGEDSDYDNDHSDLPAPVEQDLSDVDGEWDWEMPPNLIDNRHQDALQAAREGRCAEAADLASLGEREDIRAHGINSTEAASWLSTRALVAELCGSPDQATRLRATVTRMGKEVEWYRNADNMAPEWDDGSTPLTSTSPPVSDDPPTGPTRRRIWLYVSAITTLALATAVVWQNAETDQRGEKRQEQQQKAAAYKGRSGAALQIDGVNADLVARWTKDKTRVILGLSSYFDKNARYLRIDASGESASSVREDDYYPKGPEIAVPIKNHLADVTVRVAIGGKSWKEGSRAPSQTIRLSPAGVAFDAETGKKLPSDL